MIENFEFREFVDAIRAEIADEASANLSETRRVNRFVEFVIGTISDYGVIPDAEVCFFDKNAGKGRAVCHAWHIDDEEGRLDLVTAIFEDSETPGVIGKQDVEKAIKQAIRVFEFALTARADSVDPAHHEIHDFLSSIKNHEADITQIRIFVITDGNLRDASDQHREHTSGRQIYISLWDIPRLYKIRMSGRQYEAIEIDIEQRFGEPISCLSMPSNTTEYQGYLAIVPGNVLGKLYDEYGSRLMELNVRSFLQQRGKVNRGIRATILENPTRFLAFNNGISATVEGIETRRLANGDLGIVKLLGLQIVNGGQTVASIHRSMKADRAKDIDKVFVQAKISVVDPQSLDELVPMISRYSNTQNSVNEADFSSNDPFHIRIDKLSETVWAPGEQTRWFYERARGQYEVARNRFGTTVSKRKQFDSQNPKTQKFTKTDLARYLNTWAQLPDVVGQGNQKNFVNCMKRLEAARPEMELDKEYYKEVIAQAIIFKKAESIGRKLKFPAYRANAVSYTVALLSFKTVGRLDLMAIWEDQRISTATEKTIEDWMPRVWHCIVDSAGNRNVTEWAKKRLCWERVQLLDVTLPSELENELAKGDPLPNVGRHAKSGMPAVSPEDREKIARVMQVDKDVWRRISDWGQETGELATWQFGIALTLSGYAAGKWNKVPSVKQARQAVEILSIARHAGLLDVREEV